MKENTGPPKVTIRNLFMLCMVGAHYSEEKTNDVF